MARSLVAVALLLFAQLSIGAYITDKLLAGFYASPDLTTQPIRALPNGTPMEVLEERGNFSLIRLGDNSEGWVETSYITQEKPAKTMLLELQAKYAALKRHSDSDTNGPIIDVSAATSSNPVDEPSTQLIQALAQIRQLQETITELEKTAGDNAADRQQQRDKFQPWTLPLLMLGLLLSFIGGIAFKNHRIARRARQAGRP